MKRGHAKHCGMTQAAAIYGGQKGPPIMVGIQVFSNLRRVSVNGRKYHKLIVNCVWCCCGCRFSCLRQNAMGAAFDLELLKKGRKPEKMRHMFFL